MEGAECGTWIACSVNALEVAGNARDGEPRGSQQFTVDSDPHCSRRDVVRDGEIVPVDVLLTVDIVR